MSYAAQTLARTRCHCSEGQIFCEFCRALAARIIAGRY